MTICTDLPSAIFIKGQIFVAKSSVKLKIDITIDFSIKNYARWKSPQLLTRFIDGVMNFFMFLHTFIAPLPPTAHASLNPTSMFERQRAHQTNKHEFLRNSPVKFDAKNSL